MDLLKVRVDKWLWAIRFFKSRSLAIEACKSGYVTLKEKEVKASQLIQIGDWLNVKKNGIQYTIEVVRLLEKRVGAPIAQECFIDHTLPEEINKFELWFAVRSGKSEFRERGTGRPTKKERRLIDAFKDDE